MQCYYCEKAPHPGGLHYPNSEAIGVCHECGIAVCLEHGIKEKGKPLLCAECSAAAQARTAAQKAA